MKEVNKSNEIKIETHSINENRTPNLNFRMISFEKLTKNYSWFVGC